MLSPAGRSGCRRRSGVRIGSVLILCRSDPSYLPRGTVTIAPVRLATQHRRMKQTLVIAVLACIGANFGATAAEVSAEPALSAQASPKDPLVAAGHVKRALREANDLPAQDVIVSTHADTIVLTGKIDSETQAARAMAIAETAAGGVRVSSQLQVPDVPKGPEQQAVTLVQQVQKALRDDQRTSNLGVSVSIDDSQVIGLHGLVPSAENRRIAEDVAGRVGGVKRIRSHLIVPGE
jgi:osmotically-inducible protein OsmY